MKTGGMQRLRLKKKVINELKDHYGSSDTEIYQAIDQAILRESTSIYGSLEDKILLREQVFDAIRNMGILEKYIQDESITEIMVIGKSKIFIEKQGILMQTQDYFDTEEEVYQIIDQILAPINRVVNESTPIVDARLGDGSRVHIVIPPVSLEGPAITIRKFQKGGMTIEKLIQYQEFPREFAPILECFIRGRYNILISGATNSGKSSLLNALSRYIDEDERIITIEDSAELQLFHVKNLLRLETKHENTEGENEVTMNDLIKASLRMRPNRIIVGEVRGSEATAMLQAFSTGHNGSLSSIHANGAKEALSRLEIMTLMAMNIPLRAIRAQIVSSIHLVIHLEREPNGFRKIMEIQEVLGITEDGYLVSPLFRYEDKILKPVNAIHNRSNLEHYGLKDYYDQSLEKYSVSIEKGSGQ